MADDTEAQATKPSGSGVREEVDWSGQTMGDFHLLRRLGEGGMGQVYLAEQLSLKRRVALKVLRPDLAKSEASRRRFEAEAKAVAQLTHSNVVQVYAFGEFEGRNYIALEYVDGRNLREFLARRGPPEVPVALSIIRQIAAALQRAAELGIIHRDIKPENILITKKGEVKVADFGLARIAEGETALNLTQTGVTMGTPLYMSPEQVEGKPLDPRSDIYSLGVTSYHLLAGHPPFFGENAFAIALQHVQVEPPPLAEVRPDLPTELCAIVGRMMAKPSDERYQTARDVLKDLKLLTDMRNGAAPQPLIATTPVRRNGGRYGNGLGKPLRVAALVLGSLLIAGGIGSALGLWLSPPPPAEPAIISTRPNDDTFDLDELSDAARENAIKARVRQTRNPDKSKDTIQDGLRHRLDLAVLYLEQQPRELDKASAFFEEQMKSEVPQYKTFGKIGQAIVLAHRDQTVKSVEAFEALFEKLTVKRSERPEGYTLNVEFFNQLPRMRKLVSDALHQNRVNWEQIPDASKPYPANLRSLENRLRRPPGPA